MTRYFTSEKWPEFCSPTRLQRRTTFSDSLENEFLAVVEKSVKKDVLENEILAEIENKRQKTAVFE